MTTQPGHHERTERGLLFSTDRARLDIDLIHDFLSRESYWVPGIRREHVERVISDGAGFAWLADVFVAKDHRRRGIGRKLIAFVMAHPDLQAIRRFMLATRDAHDLYARFGFTPLAHPERLMERYDADALSR